jgi:hypothetical protein
LDVDVMSKYSVRGKEPSEAVLKADHPEEANCLYLILYNKRK